MTFGPGEKGRHDACILTYRCRSFLVFSQRVDWRPSLVQPFLLPKVRPQPSFLLSSSAIKYIF